MARPPLKTKQSSVELRNKYRLKQQTMESKRKLVSKQIVILVGLIIDDSILSQALDIQNPDHILIRKNECDNIKRLTTTLNQLIELERFLVERSAKEPGKVSNMAEEAQRKLIAKANTKLRQVGMDEIDDG